MLNSRNAVLAFAVPLILTGAALAQTTTTTTTFTNTSSLSPIGLATTETVQVNVVNTAAASASGTAASCTGSVAFYNASGAIIGSATSFTLGTGQISSVKLVYAAAGASGSRTVVRPVVTVTGTRPPTAPCALSYSLETYDTATGVTHVFEAGAGPDAGGFGRP